MVFTLAILLQTALSYQLLSVEDARKDPTPLVEALTSSSSDVEIQRQAIRGLGRFEREEIAPHVGPFLAAEQPGLRIEAANALAQMGAGTFVLSARLETETHPAVRQAIYEALGRLPRTTEETLRTGLTEEHPIQLGAAKGLEHWLRSGDIAPSDATKRALRDLAIRAPSDLTRQLALLALHRAGDRHIATLESSWKHDNPLVRRLALMALGEFRDDPSLLVRYAGLAVAPTCENAASALEDSSEHVVLLALDTLGDQRCERAPLVAALAGKTGWRRQAHALVALAKIDPPAAMRELPRFVAHDVWQARVYAARAAKIVDADAALSELGRDPHPRVVGASLRTVDDAAAALGNEDYGVLMDALAVLDDASDIEEHTPLMMRTLKRLTDQVRATSRDPRSAILELLSKLNPNIHVELNYLLDDFDPFIAEKAAEVMSARGHPASAGTTSFDTTPLPSLELLRSLRNARARITMKEAGSFVIELLPDEAPLTVAQFATLAEDGYYDGTTFHRVVPNFVIQGGSPGANEFVGTPGYIRDEVGRLSHERGTLGISTRGRDTGDSQIFVNLVNNFRLDHSYTVFARVVEGMANVDRIAEGDVLSRVTIERR